MRPIHAFTRGGQLAVHQYRMIKQICVVTLILSVFTGVVVSCFYFFKTTTPYQHSFYQQTLVTKFRLHTTLGDPSQVMQTVTLLNGRTQEVRADALLRHPWVKRQIKCVENSLCKSFEAGLWGAFWALFVIIGFFIAHGYRTTLKTLERGNQLVSPQKLKRLIKRKSQSFDLTLDGLPLLKNKETSHILITGTTGSGKTNCFHTLLPQIRKRPNRVIVVDLTGDYVKRYFRTGQDILLNPLDERTCHWSPWGECLEEPHYDALAAALVAKSSTTEPFWEEAAKVLLSSALHKLAKRGERDIQRLYEILIKEDLTKFAQFFQNTEAASYTHPDGEKMTLSIRATLANHLQSFRFLKAVDEGFSIRIWVASDVSDQWVFLAAKPDQRETLRPLLSAWIDTAINTLMSLASNQERRLWFILDELPALQRLPSLTSGLAEGRKYGGCFVAGIQSISQLQATYSNIQAQSMLDLFNTKIFFRNTDPTTTAWISKVLGEAEITETIENLSYGANTMRDGVNLAQQTRTKPLVLPSEIGSLKDCEAYLKLPGNFPITKFQMAINR